MKSKLMAAFFGPCAFKLRARKCTQPDRPAAAWHHCGGDVPRDMGAWYDEPAKPVAATSGATLKVHLAPAGLSFMPAVRDDYQTQWEYS